MSHYLILTCVLGLTQLPSSNRVRFMSKCMLADYSNDTTTCSTRSKVASLAWVLQAAPDPSMVIPHVGQEAKAAHRFYIGLTAQ